MTSAPIASTHSAAAAQLSSSTAFSHATDDRQRVRTVLAEIARPDVVGTRDEVAFGDDAQPRERIVRQIREARVEDGDDDTVTGKTAVVQLGHSDLRQLAGRRAIVDGRCAGGRGYAALR